MKCFYHNDLDGRCAAHCVYMWAGLHIEPFEIQTDVAYSDGKISGYVQDAEYIEMNYNKHFPIEAINNGEQIWIVDFSLKAEDMEALLKKTKDITWIDHHKTAIDKYDVLPESKNIRGVRIEGEGSGALLTYKYLHFWTARGDDPNPEDKAYPREIEIPEYIQLVSDWDEWKFQYGRRTRQFKNGAEMFDYSPTSQFWLDCNINKDDYVEKVITKGDAVMKYRESWSANFMKSWSFETKLEEYKCIAANIGSANSDMFDSVKDDYDIMIPFVFDGKQWTVSLYSETVDVGEIAKRYGGGGHTKAAGFVCDILPF
jgi:uncharacterized protein